MNQLGGGQMHYETPDIIYEGELEVQAGSPLGVPFPVPFDFDW